MGRPPLPPRTLAEEKAAMPPRRSRGDAGVVDHGLAGDLHLGRGPGALGPAGGQLSHSGRALSPPPPPPPTVGGLEPGNLHLSRWHDDMHPVCLEPA